MGEIRYERGLKNAQKKILEVDVETWNRSKDRAIAE